MANGSNVKTQFANEITYGTLPTMTRQVDIASVDFKLLTSKIDQGLLTGFRVGSRKLIGMYSVEGSLSTKAKPDNIGVFLAHALGVETAPTLVPDSTAAYKHTFTLAGTAALPSMSATVNYGGVSTKGYTGLKVDSLSFSASSGDLLNVDVNFKGKDEVTGTIQTGLSSSPLNTFRFANAVVKIGATTLPVTSVKLDLENNLDASTQTTQTGLYAMEPEQGAATIKLDIEVLYDSSTNTIREEYFKNNGTMSVEVTFLNGDEVEEDVPYSLKFILPSCAAADDANVSISGPDRIKFSLPIEVYNDGTNEPITVELVNGLSTKYIA